MRKRRSGHILNITSMGWTITMPGIAFCHGSQRRLSYSGKQAGDPEKQPPRCASSLHPITRLPICFWGRCHQPRAREARPSENGIRCLGAGFQLRRF
jgi:hypothetical protein